MSNRVPFSIFKYSNYQEYFQDAYEFLHAADESFSYDKIAVACGLKSRTLVRGILKGQQRPSLLQLGKLAIHFGLSQEEQEYAVCLHKFEAAQGSPGAFDLFQKLMVLQKAHATSKNPFTDSVLKTSVIHMTLLNVLDLERCPSTVEGIALLMKNRYTQQEVEDAIQDLEHEGFIERTTTRFVVKQKFFKEVDLNTNFFLRKYHNESLKLAYDSLHNDELDERYLVGANFSIHHKVYPRIIDKMNEFLFNLIKLEGIAGPSDSVVHLNMQLMKMTATEASSLSAVKSKTVPIAQNKSPTQQETLQ